MSRLTQVKKLTELPQLLDHLASLGIEIPVAAAVDPNGALATEVRIVDGSAAPLVAPNRFAVLPMEGWDADRSGRATDLVRRRWQRFGASGCSLVWGEATAVVPEGRANPHQLILNQTTVDDLAELRSVLSPDQVCGLQLTHSGRFANHDGTSAPRILYRHPILDDRVGATEASIISDDELDELVASFINAARLVHQAGFDFVDVKACHGYLGHEFLSAYDRPGRYGGDLAGRTLFLRSVVEGIREQVPELAVALRLSVFDMMPYVAGPGGTGQPVSDQPYRYGFGSDETGLEVDLSETHQLLDIVEKLGIGLVGATCGSPYYVPHIQRPAYFPPSDGYLPPEDPLVGVARTLAATAELTKAHPSITFVGSGYSYLQDWLPNVAQAVIGEGGATMIGLGRMMLSYPELAADALAGKPVNRRLICRTFSDCTTAPRGGLVSGCYPLDDFYKERPERSDLTIMKRLAKEKRSQAG